MSSRPDICYRCNEIATSKEHVPPKCIFPSKKDFPGQNFRKNLISVPSCDEHNLHKTTEDEFLMICLASSVHVNQIGFQHFKSKIVRALKRKHKGFLNEIIKKPKSVDYYEKGASIPVLKGKANVKRLNKCFDSIIYGLYYNTFGKKFEGKIKILNDFIIPNTKNYESLVKLTSAAFKQDPKATGIEGDNPAVFKFQFSKPDKFGLLALKMTFYGELNVLASLQPKGTKEPFNLGMALVNDGIETTFKLPDGDIKFNSREE